MIPYTREPFFIKNGIILPVVLIIPIFLMEPIVTIHIFRCAKFEVCFISKSIILYMVNFSSCAHVE